MLEILLLAGFAWLGGSAVRRWLLPSFKGAPAHLAAAVIALAILTWSAELLGTFGALDPVPLVPLVGAAAVAARTFAPRRPDGDLPPHQQVGGQTTVRRAERGEGLVSTLIALGIAAVAVVHFSLETKTRLSTGMTGFDSTWYHGPFAAGFFQGGNTWDLHFIAPQFLAWFYPANSEVFHAVGMLAFGRDVLSPLLNVGWFVGCLYACWVVGRPYGVAPWSLGLGAVALSVPALADQAGEARNDIVGIFFLLAAVAIALNAGAARGDDERGLSPGALAVIGLAAGLAAGTKLNFLLPAGVLVLGLVAIAPRGGRWRALAVSTLAALAGGGYWYLRNLAHTGNPLPWIDSLGPVSLPAPDQALGGREAHSVLGYLTDGTVWSDWLLPGLRDGLWPFWPLLVAAALAGLVLCLVPANRRGLVPNGGSNSRRSDPVLPVVALAGLAAFLAWLVAPTSASGPDGMPRGFESGLRYLAPALVLGLALLPGAPSVRGHMARISGLRSSLLGNKPTKDDLRQWGSSRLALAVIGCLGMAAVLIGYPVQRHYLENRYADPSFTTPGLNAAFAWSRDVTDSRIATTSTRQYPLFGTDLSNRVQFIGREQPHGGFQSPATCRAWRRELNEGGYDYVVASRDRMEPGQPPFPPQAGWTEGPAAEPILRKPPTVVFELSGRLGPSGCG
ncbi:MAG TPA: hypothetical protein VFY48_11345 [Solirubrobacterales bacterium]|nr:hypothetical protein [Solirubrobacterales bacterium]